MPNPFTSSVCTELKSGFRSEKEHICRSMCCSDSTKYEAVGCLVHIKNFIPTDELYLIVAMSFEWIFRLLNEQGVPLLR